MITTRAYIVQIPENNDNHFKVRVPFMEDNTGEEAIYDALLCVSPTSYNGYSVGDVVFVTFENNKYNNASAVYRQCVKQVVNAGMTSISDLQSDEFKEYINNTNKSRNLTS